jgi:predicted lipoprotein with Yx(FWY)xxD motif
MRTRFAALAAAAAAVTLLALAGCSGGAGTSLLYGGSGSPAPSHSATSAGLSTAKTSLGTIVVDGSGMTVYVFDKDTRGSGTSSCSGTCAAQWPALETNSAKPQVSGVTGTVGTIPALDGGKQLTLDGWPLYTFAGDSSAGDVTGQGLGGIWWVVGPDGAKIGAAATTGGAGSGGYSK